VSQFYFVGPKQTNFQSMTKIFQVIRNHYPLLAILLVASFLRFYKLDFQSLWVDEILTMNHTNPDFSFKETYDKVMFWEFIPHLFFYLCKLFFSAFGYSSLTGRILSGIIGVLGVYAMYLLGKKLTNKNGGLIAAALIAVNSFHITFSQEIRPYGLLFLFTVLSFYRLFVFFEKTNFKNAIIFGVFSSLILHAHFFGFITLFSQLVIWFFMLYQKSKEERKPFFICSIIAALTIIVVFLPALEPFIRVKNIDSFWLPKPSATVYTEIFKSFLGNSELLIFMAQALVILFFVFISKQNISNEKNYSRNNITFVTLSIWLLISLLIPLIKSHLDVPMILSRYFINILPILILAITFGFVSIKNSLLKRFLLIAFLLISLIDLFVVQQFYHTVRKTQYREVTQKIIENNPSNYMVFTQWDWIVGYWFRDYKETKVLQGQLDILVNEMKINQKSQESFWFVGTNSQPFQISESSKSFLEENFILEYQFEYFDAWAHFYRLKNEASKTESLLKITDFFNINLDDSNHWALWESGTCKSRAISLKKGTYNITILGNSWPQIPINNENAHIVIKQNSKIIADFYLSEKTDKAENSFEFEIEEDQEVIFEVTFDNDITINGQDRNAIIYNISLVQKPQIVE
jgi:4-amino-4-deoxy-L-arabinose transferase-like glycosyltransferase